MDFAQYCLRIQLKSTGISRSGSAIFVPPKIISSQDFVSLPRRSHIPPAPGGAQVDPSLGRQTVLATVKLASPCKCDRHVVDLAGFGNELEGVCLPRSRFLFWVLKPPGGGSGSSIGSPRSVWVKRKTHWDGFYLVFRFSSLLGTAGLLLV